MGKRTQFHVVKGGDSWLVKQAGSNNVVAEQQTKAKAVSVGREVAQSTPHSQLVIHKVDGSFQTEHTYGDDPYPPRG